jgi:ABC-type lipoprotein release transport system permease subunit
MGTRLDAARVLLRIAFRNLLASRAKTAIMGGIIGLGSLLVVFGTAIVDSLDSGMARSIQGSLTAHLQLYRKDSPDSLQVFGGMTGPSRLEPMENYEQVKKVVGAVPNVKAVVPMGIDRAFVSSGNVMDQALEKLRADAKEVFPQGAGKRASPAAAPEARQRYQARKAHVRRMISILREELGQARALVDIPPAERAERAAQWANLERADTSAFWNAFDHNPWTALEFLENKIAPLQTENGFLFIRYLGTDLEAFRKAFDRMEVVEGTPVPPGQRGLLLGKFYAEEFLKLKHARRLDKIKEARARGRRIANDEELQRFVAENTSQTRDILLQLDPAQAEAASARLGAFLGVPERDLAKLLPAFFQTDDANFDARERFFYAELAPMLQLYTFRVGDVITIKAPAKSGYMNAVNVKIYGVVAFKGLEDSSLASVFTLMDLQSFRDLYGWVTPDKAAEIAEIKRSAGLTDLRLVAPSSQARASAIPDVAVTREKRGRESDLFARVYSQEEIDRGVVMNVAVALKDPRRLRETQAAIQKAVDDAKLNLTVIDWKQAAGTLGQTMTGLQVALYASAFILFVIALVIMNNAMVMAMLQRVKEIGTMRAIGAQRRFVLLMSLVESIAVGLVFGLAGAGAAAGLVAIVRALGGIRSDNAQLQFLFSGPTLMPRFAGSGLAVALGIVIFVSVISGIYPAILATRITPIEAMQSED